MMGPVSKLLFSRRDKRDETKVKYSNDDGAMTRFMTLFNPPRGR